LPIYQHNQWTNDLLVEERLTADSYYLPKSNSEECKTSLLQGTLWSALTGNDEADVQAILRFEDVWYPSKRQVENTEDEGTPHIEEEDHQLRSQQDWFSAHSVRGEGCESLLKGVLILFCSAATKDRSARSVGAFHRSSPVSRLLLYISTVPIMTCKLTWQP
jgi:hypothetical protein